MISLRRIGADAVSDAWNRSATPQFQIDAELAKQNLLDSSLFDDEASSWIDGSFVAIKGNAAGLYDGPDPKTAHLSLIGTNFDSNTERALAHAVASLKEKGIEAIQVGMDNGHFLPGAPEAIETMGPWLESQGFVAGGIAVDLESDLAECPDGVRVAPGEYRALRSDDIETLDRFLAREFPGRWRYDTLRKVQAEGPQTVFGLFIDDACEGFATIQQEGCHLPIGGAAWRNSLGPSWGSLGPIGVSKHLRGRGYGHAVLGCALAELRDRGARQSIIDWTTLVVFYGAHGFNVTRRYRAYRLEFSADRRP